MSNTQTRILSAIALLLIFGLALSFKTTGLTILIFISGVFLVDEFVHNLLKLKRKHASYIMAMISFIAGFALFNFLDRSDVYYNYFIHTGAALNTVLIAYLFFEPMQAKFIISIMKRYAFFMGIFFLVPLSAMAYLLTKADWAYYVVLMLLVNFLADTGAWFFGKNFGNTKLWPTISPKKTRAGAIGGAFTSVVLSSLFIYFVFNKLNLFIVVSLLILAIFAQIGDLIESKLKRQFDVKDSSNLIPGHGGIYDRLDSLLFVAPFYVMMVKYLL